DNDALFSEQNSAASRCIQSAGKTAVFSKHEEALIDSVYQVAKQKADCFKTSHPSSFVLIDCLSPSFQFLRIKRKEEEKAGESYGFCDQIKLKPCPLCDEAKEVLEPYKKRFILQEVDITLPENSTWYNKYKYDIPVFHLNGKFLMKHQVDIQKFEEQLTELERHNDGNH
ncbi:UNVERIFIED_CONTAM: hypothetical protein H355_006922, partial [Colinus virginianus]